MRGTDFSQVVIRFPQADKKGDKPTFEGKFDLVAVLGPALVDCKLVKDADQK